MGVTCPLHPLAGSSRICHLQVIHRALGEGFPPLTWLGQSCDALKLSVGLLFSSFGYKNPLVSNRDADYGLGFAVRIMFRLAREAPSVLAEDRHCCTCWKLLCSLFLRWAPLAAHTGRSLRCCPGSGLCCRLGWVTGGGDGISSLPALPRAVRLAATRKRALKSPILIFFFFSPQKPMRE